MSSYKNRLILALTGYGLLVGALVAVLLHNFSPGFSWNWFLGVFIFFLALESVIIILVANNGQKKDKNKLVNIYMLTKTIKIVLSLVFVLIYYAIERSNNIKIFAIVFIVFYILFLIAETYLLSKIEKYIKLNNDEE